MENVYCQTRYDMVQVVRLTLQPPTVMIPLLSCPRFNSLAYVDVIWGFYQPDNNLLAEPLASAQPPHPLTDHPSPLQHTLRDGRIILHASIKP